eukprot:gene5236-18466_t
MEAVRSKGVQVNSLPLGQREASLAVAADEVQEPEVQEPYTAIESAIGLSAQLLHPVGSQHTVNVSQLPAWVFATSLPDMGCGSSNTSGVNEPVLSKNKKVQSQSPSEPAKLASEQAAVPVKLASERVVPSVNPAIQRVASPVKLESKQVASDVKLESKQVASDVKLKSKQVASDVKLASERLASECSLAVPSAQQRHTVPGSTGSGLHESDVAAMALGADTPANCMMVVQSTRLKCQHSPIYRLVTKAGNAASWCTYFACGTHAGGNTKWWMDNYERQKLP